MRSLSYCMSLGVKNIAKEFFTKFIITDDRFWTVTVKVGIEVMGIDMREYFE